MGENASPNSGSSENCRNLHLKIFVQNTKFGAEKTPILGKFRSKVEILNTHDFHCQKFATVYQKFAVSVGKFNFLPHLLF